MPFVKCLLQGGPGSVRFGYGLGMERFKRFRFSVPAVPPRRGFLCVSAQFNREDGSGSGFGSWKTVPAVPVPRSVPGRTVPTVPVSGPGSVPGPPCFWVSQKYCARCHPDAPRMSKTTPKEAYLVPAPKARCHQPSRARPGKEKASERQDKPRQQKDAGVCSDPAKLPSKRSRIFTNELLQACRESRIQDRDSQRNLHQRKIKGLQENIGARALRGSQRLWGLCTLSEPLSDCHFPLRVAGPVAPDHVAPQTSYNSDTEILLTKNDAQIIARWAFRIFSVFLFGPESSK